MPPAHTYIMGVRCQMRVCFNDVVKQFARGVEGRTSSNYSRESRLRRGGKEAEGRKAKLSGKCKTRSNTSIKITHRERRGGNRRGERRDRVIAFHPCCKRNFLLQIIASQFEHSMRIERIPYLPGCGNFRRSFRLECDQIETTNASSRPLYTSSHAKFLPLMSVLTCPFLVVLSPLVPVL